MFEEKEERENVFKSKEGRNVNAMKGSIVCYVTHLICYAITCPLHHTNIISEFFMSIVIKIKGLCDLNKLALFCRYYVSRPLLEYA